MMQAEAYDCIINEDFLMNPSFSADPAVDIHRLAGYDVPVIIRKVIDSSG